MEHLRPKFAGNFAALGAGAQPMTRRLLDAPLSPEVGLGRLRQLPISRGMTPVIHLVSGRALSRQLSTNPVRRQLKVVQCEARPLAEGFAARLAFRATQSLNAAC